MRGGGALLKGVAITFVLVATAAVVPATATAALSGRTDVLLLIDTSGSMSEALEPAVDDVNEIADRLRSELGDVDFGVAQVRDYPLSIFGNEGGGVPYEVVQPITGDKEQVSNALFGLYAEGGGDLPEAYGRALRDADVGAGLGWRPGARRLVILVADDMPHDDDLNLGIPASVQIEPSPYDTIPDPGNDEIVGTADDIDWQAELTQLAEHGLPLMFVLFEGREELLPYWQTWAAWTGGEAATADSANLAEIVVELARRGATATLPYCPPGQSRDEARRCRPYWDWLGYGFSNGDLPQWAGRDGLGREDVLTSTLLHRTFSDIKLPAWWAFWQHDPRGEMWRSMRNGVCYGMALSGGRFSTALEPQLAPTEGRTSASWGAPVTPTLPGPTGVPDPVYERELLQKLAGDFVSQYSTEVGANLLEQRSHFTHQSRLGRGEAALREGLEAVMSTGRTQVASSPLGSEQAAGIALVALWNASRTAGHAVVAFDMRNTEGGGFQIEVWDNNRPFQVSSLVVHSDGSWEYPPLGWSGGPENLAFLPEYPARGLHLEEGGDTAGGHEVAIVDVPAGATKLHAGAEDDRGGNARVSVQPEIIGGGGPQRREVVTDGSRVQVSFQGDHAGAVARGSGRLLSATGLTGAHGGQAKISYDIDAAAVSAGGPRGGTLAVTRGARHVAATGATTLQMSRGGTTVLRTRHGGKVVLVFSSAAGGPLASTKLALHVPKGAVVTVRGRQVTKAIRHGGEIAVSVRHGKRRGKVRVTTRSVASVYRLRAHLRVKGHKAKLTLSARRRLPKGAEGHVEWRLKRHGKTVRRLGSRIAHPRTHRVLARLRLPRHLRGLTVKAIVHVTVSRPGPARLTAADAHLIPARVKHHRHGSRRAERQSASAG